MSNIDKRETELLIENGVLVADTLRHLAYNEIDSDYFAVCHTNENGTEIECELAITDYARQAAGTVDELVKALEAVQTVSAARLVAIDTTHKMFQRERDRAEKAEKRIAELEAREVKLPELKMLRDYLAEVTHREREDILVGVRLEFFRALEEAGVKAAAAGKGE